MSAVVEIVWRWNKDSMTWSAQHRNGEMRAVNVGRRGDPRWQAEVYLGDQKRIGHVHLNASLAEDEAKIMMQKLSEDSHVTG